MNPMHRMPREESGGIAWKLALAAGVGALLMLGVCGALVWVVISYGHNR